MNGLPPGGGSSNGGSAFRTSARPMAEVSPLIPRAEAFGIERAQTEQWIKDGLIDFGTRFTLRNPRQKRRTANLKTFLILLSGKDFDSDRPPPSWRLRNINLRGVYIEASELFVHKYRALLLENKTLDVEVVPGRTKTFQIPSGLDPKKGSYLRPSGEFSEICEIAKMLGEKVCSFIDEGLIFNNIEYTKQLRIGLNFFSVGSVMGRILDPNRFVLQLFYIEVDRNPTHVSPRQFYYFDCEKRIVMNITDEEDLALFRDEQFFYRVAPLVIKYQGNQGEVEIRPVE